MFDKIINSLFDKKVKNKKTVTIIKPYREVREIKVKEETSNKTSLSKYFFDLKGLVGKNFNALRSRQESLKSLDFYP